MTIRNSTASRTISNYLRNRYSMETLRLRRGHLNFRRIDRPKKPVAGHPGKPQRGFEIMHRILALLLMTVPILPAQIEDVVEGERLFQATCAVCHGPEGNAVPGIDFAQGRWKRVSKEEDIEQFVAKGIPGTSMPPFDRSEERRVG